MLKRRIILGVFILATGVFASFFGGAARTLFYAALFIPLFSIIYTLYVFIRFRIYQSADNKVIIKGEKTPYYFTLADEDFISYTDVRIEFLDDFSTPQNMELSRSYHLSPKEKIINQTEILCRYRGEYNIGVKNVIITDLFGIIRVKYPAPSTISMTVLPKITKLEKLTLAPLDSDAKLLRFSHCTSSEPPDCETRKYVKGDSIKLINWKLSAKKRELFVRQTSDIRNNEIIFIMDTTHVSGGEFERVITEDKIIESGLAIADYLVRKNVPLTIVYEQEKLFSDYIGSPSELKAFYGKCAALTFRSVHSAADLFAALPCRAVSSSFVIFAVSSLTSELCTACESVIRLGGDAAVILVGNGNDECLSALDQRVILAMIHLNDEISDVLGGANEH